MFRSRLHHQNEKLKRQVLEKESRSHGEESQEGGEEVVEGVVGLEVEGIFNSFILG